MTDLSPSAQAVLYAAHNAPDGRDSYRMSAAAALRAAAIYSYCPVDRKRLASIADELDPPSS